jgi:LPXTG-motif cell wall-anchored protein
VADPGEPPEDPGAFDRIKPQAPKPTIRLEHAQMLEELSEKIIAIVVPQDPDVPGEPPVVEPEIIFVDEITIADDEVPLAQAPKTGDISTLWAAISGLSLGGISLLNRKRRNK